MPSNTLNRKPGIKGGGGCIKFIKAGFVGFISNIKVNFFFVWVFLFVMLFLNVVIYNVTAHKK